MTLQTSGPISFENIRAEFGGGYPISISDYYRGGARVPNVSQNNNIPTSGPITLSNFYGATNYFLNASAVSYGDQIFAGTGNIETYSFGVGQANVSGTSPPFTYAWSIVSDPGAGGTLTLTTSNTANPIMRLQARISDRTPTLQCVVGDSTGNTITTNQITFRVAIE